MNEINYTVIIPHKNIPDLLVRCLDSIPRREDIQIIIVDDNSDPDKVDFANFPGLNDPYIEVIFGKNENGRKGAGYARNLGLEKAKGKWLIFADADDFFMPCFNEVLDKYKDDDSDVIYCGLNSVYSDTLQPCNREGSINEDLMFAKACSSFHRDKIRYRFLYTTSKIIKTSLIKKNNILFDEVPASNDTMFSVKTAVAAQFVSFDTAIIYCITYRKNSLVTSYKYEYLKSRLIVSFELYRFLKKIGKEQFAQSPTQHWLQIRHCSKRLFVQDLNILLKNYSLIKIIEDITLCIIQKLRSL